MIKNDDTLHDEEQEHNTARKIYLMLAKLDCSGRPLPPSAKRRLDLLSEKYPTWRPAEDESDEFVIWSESYWGNKIDITINELFKLPLLDLLSKLQEDSPYHEGRIEAFQTGAQSPENYATVINILKHLAQQDIKDVEIWKGGLFGLAESKSPIWLDVAVLLSEVDPLFLAEFNWAAASWVRKSSKFIGPNSAEESYFWTIVNNLLMIPQNLPINMQGNIYTIAINHAVGLLTEAILNRLAIRKLTKNTGIPTDNFLSCFNILMDDKQDSYLLGRVILASRLIYIYTIDPSWAKEQLISKLDWSSSQEAKYMWQGYLSNYHISLELASEIKEFLLLTLKKSGELPERTEELHRLFALMCLEFPDIYSTAIKQSALREIGVLGLRNIAKFMWQAVAHTPEKENYWSNRIKPFISIVWPKDKKYVDSEIAHFLALMSIEITISFPEVRACITNFLEPFPNQIGFLHDLNSKEELISLYPADVANLISQVFNGKYYFGEIELLEDIFKKVYIAQPQLKNRSELKDINDYLKKNRQKQKD